MQYCRKHLTIQLMPESTASTWLHTGHRNAHCSHLHRTPSGPHSSIVNQFVQCHIAHLDGDTDFWTVDCARSETNTGTEDRYTHTEVWRPSRPLYLQWQSLYQDQEWSSVSHKVVWKIECPGCTRKTRSWQLCVKLPLQDGWSCCCHCPAR